MYGKFCADLLILWNGFLSVFNMDHCEAPSWENDSTRDRKNEDLFRLPVKNSSRSVDLRSFAFSPNNNTLRGVKYFVLKCARREKWQKFLVPFRSSPFNTPPLLLAKATELLEMCSALPWLADDLGGVFDSDMVVMREFFYLFFFSPASQLVLMLIWLTQLFKTHSRI